MLSCDSRGLAASGLDLCNASRTRQVVGQYEDDPQSWNLFAYARNNRLIHTDPTGQDYRLYDKDKNVLGEVKDAKELTKLGYVFVTSKEGGNRLEFEGGFYAEYFEGDSGPMVEDLDDSGMTPLARGVATELARRKNASLQAINIIAQVNFLPIPLITGSGLARGGITALGIGGSRVLVTGQLIARTIQTAKGSVDVLAEVVVQGDKLWLKDIVIYGRGPD